MRLQRNLFLKSRASHSSLMIFSNIQVTRVKLTFGLKASGLLFNIDLSRIPSVLVVDDPAGNNTTHRGRPISCSCILLPYNQLFYSPYHMLPTQNI